MFNKIIVVGNFTRDIELRYAQSGTAIANTSIATSRKFTANGEKKEEVCFIDVVFFGRSAEVANQYTRKGSKILLEGRIQFEQWIDKNGGKRSKHSIIVETMQMLDTRADQAALDEKNRYQPADNHTDYKSPPPQSRNHQTAKAGRQPPPPDNTPSLMDPQNIPEIDIDEDEIPF